MAILADTRVVYLVFFFLSILFFFGVACFPFDFVIEGEVSLFVRKYSIVDLCLFGCHSEVTPAGSWPFLVAMCLLIVMVTNTSLWEYLYIWKFWPETTPLKYAFVPCGHLDLG